MTLSSSNGSRQWRVWFGGDPEYGRSPEGEYRDQATVVEAVDASSAVRSVMAQWRRDDALYVAEEGWYGEGTRAYVQEVVEPPPVKAFVKTHGRMKLERGSR